MVATRTQVLAIDCDGHIEENSARLVEYMEEPFREFRTTSNISATLVPLDGHDRNLGERLYRGDARNAAEWVAAMAKGPMERVVVFPTLGLFSGFVKDPDYQSALCRAYNSWLAAEVCNDPQDRVLGVGLMPVHDADAAAAELHRSKELGMAGVMLPADGTHLLGDKRFDALYQAAAERDFPVAIHASGSSNAPGAEVFPKFIQAHAVAPPYGILRQFTSMMFEGTFEKFPTVRFAFLEAGVTWVPWWLDRLNEEYENRGAVDAPLLNGPPSSYVKPGGNIFFSCEAEERLLGAVLDLIGEDIVMYASDFPHWDGSYPDSLHTLQARSDITESQKHGILRGAAARFYGLD